MRQFLQNEWPQCAILIGAFRFSEKRMFTGWCSYPGTVRVTQLRYDLPKQIAQVNSGVIFSLIGQLKVSYVISKLVSHKCDNYILKFNWNEKYVTASWQRICFYIGSWITWMISELVAYSGRLLSWFRSDFYPKSSKLSYGHFMILSFHVISNIFVKCFHPYPTFETFVCFLANSNLEILPYSTSKFFLMQIMIINSSWEIIDWLIL